MRKFFVTLLLCLPFALMAQQKIAIVDTQKIMTGLPDVAQVQNKIQELAKKYDADIKNMQDELKKKAEEYTKEKEKGNMLETIQKRKEQELQDIQVRIQQSYAAMQEDLQKQQQTLLAPVQQKVSAAIKKVSDSMGVAYVLDAAVILNVGSDALDITKKVEDALGIKESATKK